MTSPFVAGTWKPAIGSLIGCKLNRAFLSISWVFFHGLSENSSISWNITLLSLSNLASSKIPSNVISDRLSTASLIFLATLVQWRLNNLDQWSSSAPQNPQIFEQFEFVYRILVSPCAPESGPIPLSPVGRYLIHKKLLGKVSQCDQNPAEGLAISCRCQGATFSTIEYSC